MMLIIHILISWFALPFYTLQCDPFCVDGTRSRRVWCEFVRDGTVVADTNCGCDSRPPEMELCTNVPGLDQCFLRPLWKTGEFSAVRHHNEFKI